MAATERERENQSPPNKKQTGTDLSPSTWPQLPLKPADSYLCQASGPSLAPQPLLLWGGRQSDLPANPETNRHEGITNGNSPSLTYSDPRGAQLAMPLGSPHKWRKNVDRCRQGMCLCMKTWSCCKSSPFPSFVSLQCHFPQQIPKQSIYNKTLSPQIYL